MITITAFGDETGTHDDSPVMMLAGYVGGFGRLRPFNQLWRQALSEARLEYWHSTDHWKTQAGVKFIPIAESLIRKRFLFGYVIELDKASYETVYLGGERPKKPQLDTRYSVCFRHLAAFMFLRLSSLLGRDDVVVNFVLEDGARGSGHCGQLLRDMKKQVPETQSMLGAVNFGDKKKNPCLQAADYLAFGALKLMATGPLLLDVPDHDTLTAARERTLVNTIPVYHCQLDAKMLGVLKSDIMGLVAFRQQIAAESVRK